MPFLADASLVGSVVIVGYAEERYEKLREQIGDFYIDDLEAFNAIQIELNLKKAADFTPFIEPMFVFSLVRDSPVAAFWLPSIG